MEKIKLMENITPEQVWNIMICGTAAILAFIITIVGIVIYTSKKRRQWDKEIVELRAKMKKEKPAEDSEFIEISNGRKVKRR